MMRKDAWVWVTSMLLALMLAAGAFGCGDDDDDGSADGEAGAGGEAGSGGAADGSGTDELCPVIVADADCDTSKRPFVFVHGTYGSGDNIANVAMLFGSNGYCQDRFVAVEYNSLGGDPLDALMIGVFGVLIAFPDVLDDAVHNDRVLKDHHVRVENLGFVLA